MVNQWVAKYGLFSAAWTVAARLWLLLGVQFEVLFILVLVITRGHSDSISIALFVLGMTCAAVAFVHGVAAWRSGRSRS